MNPDRVTEHSGIDNIGNTADSSHTDSIDMKIESRYLEQALRLHKQHPVVDMHLDLAGELVLRHELGEQNVLYHRYLKNFYQAGIRVIASSIYVANCDLDHAWANALMQIKLLKGEIVTCNLELQRSREKEPLYERVLLIQSRQDLAKLLDQKNTEKGSLEFFFIWKVSSVLEKRQTDSRSFSGRESVEQRLPGAERMHWQQAAVRLRSIVRYGEDLLKRGWRRSGNWRS